MVCAVCSMDPSAYRETWQALGSGSKAPSHAKARASVSLNAGYVAFAFMRARWAGTLHAATIGASQLSRAPKPQDESLQWSAMEFGSAA